MAGYRYQAIKYKDMLSLYLIIMGHNAYITFGS